MPLTKVNTAMVSSGGGDVASNTALGPASLNSNTTGANNVAVGQQALQANTTASNNAAVGYQAGYSNTTGTANTYLGYQSGLNNTTGGYNTFVGWQTGGQTTSTGQYNTLVGAGAGAALTTGSANTFIGFKNASNGAGYLISTGSKNVIIGGYGGNEGGFDIRTSSNCIALSDGDGNLSFIKNAAGDMYFGGTTVRYPGDGNTSNGMMLEEGLRTLYVSRSDGYTLGIGRNNSTGVIIKLNYNGSQAGTISVSSGSATYNSGSDYRLKENIAPMTGALEKVQQLKPCTYTWKADSTSGHGFIAHELQQVIPEVVQGVKDGIDDKGNPDYQTVDYGKLTTTLVAAIQELNAKVEAQAAEIAALKAAP